MKRHGGVTELIGEQICKGLAVEIVRRMCATDNISGAMLKKKIGCQVWDEADCGEDVVQQEKERVNGKDATICEGGGAKESVMAWAASRRDGFVVGGR